MQVNTTKRHNMKYIVMISMVASLGGLLFGYDTSVISGAVSPLKEYFNLNAAETGWAVSNVVIGCIIGAFGSGEIARKLGRKKTLIFAALLFTISAVGSALATNFTWFVIYRMVGGLAVGVASAISPMYISEVAPKNYRGTATAMNSFAIVFGQILIFYINYKLAQGMAREWLVELGWRYMLGSEAIPCILFLITVVFIPESPRWNVMRGRDDLALATLTKISNQTHAQNLLNEIRFSVAKDDGQRQKQKLDFSRDGAKFILMVGIGIATLSQLSGINVMMYYAPAVLERIVGSAEEALFQTIWIGVAQLMGITIGFALFDKLGRLPLMRTGLLGIILSLLIISYAMYTQNPGYLALFGMMAFMLSFGMSWAVGMWVLLGEIFPNYMRAQGMAIAVALNWVANFIISQGFPMINDNQYLVENFHGAFPMWLFASIGVIGFLFLQRCVPETKGVSLEKMEKVMIDKRDGKI